LVPFVASALAQAAVVIAAVVIVAVVLTVGTEGASKLARHGMVLGFDSSYF
jgi:hypothetical protein